MAYKQLAQIVCYIFQQWPRIVGLRCLYKLFNNVTWTFGLRFKTFGLGLKAFGLMLKTFGLMLKA
jgi:hypothetical protein